MPLEYQDEPTTSSKNGIPNGALTILIIAAIAIVSVVITLFCMLVNNRRTVRLRQRQQNARPGGGTVLRLSATPSALSSPIDTTNRPMGFPPMYICSNMDPKFDAPPSYEDAVRAMAANGGEHGQIQQLNANSTNSNSSTSITIETQNENGTSAAEIEVDQTHVHIPTTSSAV